MMRDFLIDLKFPSDFSACRIVTRLPLSKLAKPLSAMTGSDVLNRPKAKADMYSQSLQVLYASNDSLEGFAPLEPLDGVYVERRCILCESTKMRISKLLEFPNTSTSLDVCREGLEFMVYKTDEGYLRLRVAAEVDNAKPLTDLLGSFSAEVGPHFEHGIKLRNPGISHWVTLSDGTYFGVMRNGPANVIEIKLSDNDESDAVEPTKRWFDRLFGVLDESWDAQIHVAGRNLENVRDLCLSVEKDWCLSIPRGYQKRFDPFKTPNAIGKFGMHYSLLWFSNNFDNEHRFAGVFLNIVHKQGVSYLELNSFEGKSEIQSVFERLQAEVPALQDAVLEYWEGDPMDRWYPTN